MKTILFVLLVICYCHCSPTVVSSNNGLPPTGRSFFDQKLRAKLESLREQMKTGVPFLDNAVLDPFNLGHADFQFDIAGFLSANLEVENFHLENLATFDVTEAKFSMGKQWNVTVALQWPGQINFETAYGVNAQISDTYHIYGRGNLSVNVEQLKFSFTTLVAVREEHVQIDIQSLFVGLAKVKFAITGLFYDESLSELLSSVITDMLPELLTDYQEEIVGYVLPFIQNQINAELLKVDLDTIMSVIMGF